MTCSKVSSERDLMALLMDNPLMALIAMVTRMKSKWLLATIATILAAILKAIATPIAK